MSGIPDPTLSFPGARLTVEMTAMDFEPQGSHLYFWFQKSDAKTGKAANFAFIRRPLERELRDRVRTTMILDLEEDENAWSALGSCRQREYLYQTDMPLGDAMRHVNVAFGFILIPIDPTCPPKGSFLIHSVSIEEVVEEHGRKRKDYSSVEGVNYAINSMGMAMRVAGYNKKLIRDREFYVFDIALRFANFATSQNNELSNGDIGLISAHMGIIRDAEIIRPSWWVSSLLQRALSPSKGLSSETVFSLAFELNGLGRCSLVYWVPGFAGEDTMIVLPLSSPKEASQ